MFFITLFANSRSKKLHESLNNLTGKNETEWFKDLTLSQKAIHILNSIDGISCTLVGMRQKKYADDVIESLKMPSMENPDQILQSAGENTSKEKSKENGKVKSKRKKKGDT